MIMERLHVLASRMDDNQDKIGFIEETLESDNQEFLRILLYRRIKLQIKMIDEFLEILGQMDPDESKSLDGQLNLQ